jgi:hypothetical protein
MVEEVEGGTLIQVGTPLEYGDYVEFGTRPHFPPIKPIFQWVENNLNVTSVGIAYKEGKVVPTGKGTRQFSKSRFGSSHDRNMAVYQIAHAIQWKIAHYGTPGQFFMRRALTEMGLPFTVIHGTVESTYEIDVAAYLQPRIEMIMKQSGMAN